MKIFKYKKSDIFHISALNIDCMYSLEPPHRGGSNEYPQSMFWAEIRKLMYTPVNPSFTILKWGLRGSKLYRHVFVMLWPTLLTVVLPVVFLCSDVSSYQNIITTFLADLVLFINSLTSLVPLFWLYSYCKDNFSTTRSGLTTHIEAPTAVFSVVLSEAVCFRGRMVCYCH